MKKILSLIKEDPEFISARDTFKECLSKDGALPIAVNGLSSGAEDAFIASMAECAIEYAASPSLVLTPSEDERKRVYLLLTSLGYKAVEYKFREPVIHNISASHDIERERLSALSALLSGRCDFVVTTPGAAVGYTMPRRVLESLSLSLSVGDEMGVDLLCDKLTSLGFVRLDIVESKGQFARRGGIVDFWSNDKEYPTRVEFFGDEIDRMVSFDPLSQRALSSIQSVELLPAQEVVVDAEAKERIKALIKKGLSNPALAEEARVKLRAEMSAAEGGLSLNFKDKYISAVYKKRECLLSYFNPEKKTPIFILGTSGCNEDRDKTCEALRSMREELVLRGLLSPSAPEYFFSKEEYNRLLSDNICLHINSFAGGLGSTKLSGLFGFRTKRCVAYGGNPSMLIEDVLSYKRLGYRTVILSANAGGVNSVVNTLTENGIGANKVLDTQDLKIENLAAGTVTVAVGACEGFELITPKIVVLSTQDSDAKEAFTHKRRQRAMRRIGNSAERLMSHAELTVGDYVVHANYGIGKFLGMESVTVDGVTRDYITIQYQGTDRLFVPCDRLEMLGRYIGERDKNGEVKLSKMGGGDWTRAKSRAKKAAQDIAKNLITLYAERQRLPGFAFPSMPELEEEFENGFMYEETPSQLTAIEEIKRDMERSVPMNRLLCGDVGFGKTEVALRAAYKAILAGKQVALLVPTTILALQHFQTATSRMRGQAINIEMLSRFKSAKEKKEILSKTKKGGVDLLIGTHSLLSKQIEFSNLGLLIIDEEQRFGVVQKERLRELAKNVDTLMLSATPIPRTLNMAMSGISDISVLDEAPGERKPVQTYVLEYDEETLFDAIRKELSRGGQVLYLLNKIIGLDIRAGRIAEAFPNARIAYAHGQMEHDELEDIWQSLVRGEIDILVCTNIIETGVDLPNANTMIIEDADRFGLSQLHQIRGRVGRSARQAYAYFTYRAGLSLSETANKRLQAIKDYAEFGAGFNIALCDLEIRGAGNLLGAEQHGYIESVGYDLYLKLLNEAVIEQTGGAKEKREETVVSLNQSAFIPEGYISTAARRMEMYRKIAEIKTVEDYDELVDEFTDRFGDMPKPVVRLLNVALSRSLGTEAGIKRIEVRGTKIIFVTEKPDLAVWSLVFAEHRELSLVPATPNVCYRMRAGEDASDCILKVMRSYDKARKE